MLPESTLADSQLRQPEDIYYDECPPRKKDRTGTQIRMRSMTSRLAVKTDSWDLQDSLKSNAV